MKFSKKHFSLSFISAVTVVGGILLVSSIFVFSQGRDNRDKDSNSSYHKLEGTDSTEKDSKEGKESEGEVVGESKEKGNDEPSDSEDEETVTSNNSSSKSENDDKKSKDKDRDSDNDTDGDRDDDNDNDKNDDDDDSTNERENEPVEDSIAYKSGDIIVKYEGALSEDKFASEIKKSTGLSDVQVKRLRDNVYLVHSSTLQQASSDYLATAGAGDEESYGLDAETIQTLEKVSNILGVVYSEPDFQVKALQFTPPPNDLFYSDQWALNNTGQTGGTSDADMDVEEAWDEEQGSSDVVIAVIDTGVDLDHPDLESKILWSGGSVVGYDFVNDDSNPDDDYGHGTHCAGIIAAETNNSIGIAGVCPNCKIIPLKFLDAYGSGWTSDAILSFQYAIDHGADVISNSWGGYGYSQALQDVINDAYAQGIITVAAAGNDNTSQESYPEAMKHVISVAATDYNDARAGFSNYGSHIDVSAPGVDILSTLPPGAYLSSSCNDANHGGVSDGYGYCTGTSMAAPQVSGVVGLIKSWNSSLSTDKVMRRVFESVDDLGDPGWDQYFGWGRINAYYAVDGSFVPSAYIHALITYPEENYLFGEQIKIEGSAFARDFISYTIEVGYGASPSSWQTTGVTLENGGLVEIMEGELGIWDASGVASGIWTIKLTVFAQNGQKEVFVRVTNSEILEAGFPVQTWHGSGTYHGGEAIHTLVDDITGDGYKEIIVTALASGPLYAFDYQGNLLPGWPVWTTRGGALYPVAADGIVVAGAYDSGIEGDIAAFDASGAKLWENPLPYTDYIATPPSIEYVVSQGKMGVFVEQEDSKLHAYDLMDGSVLAGWPVKPAVTMNGWELHTPALGDIDGDGEIEIITGSGWLSGGTEVYAINEDGSVLWAKEQDDPDSYFSLGCYAVDTFSVIGDIDGDDEQEVVVACEERIYILDSMGNEQSTWLAEGGVAYGTVPALADMNGDRIPEIIVQTNDYIHVTDAYGNAMPNWPLEIAVGGSSGESSPVVGDVDGDADLEIVFTTHRSGSCSTGYMHVVNQDGTYVAGFPREMQIGSGAVPAIADIDQDSHNEIIISGSYWCGSSGYFDKVWAFDLNRNEPNVIHRGIEWGQFCHDAQHTCRYEPREVGNADVSVAITDSPDPVYAGDTLSYNVTVANNGPEEATFVSLSFGLPSTVDFISAMPQQGNCSHLGGVVTCSLGTLGVGSLTYVDIVTVPTCEGGDRTITVTASIGADEDDPNLGNNAVSEDTYVNCLDLSPLVMVYPYDGQILEWGADKSYMFKVEPREDAAEYQFAFSQNGLLIHEESTTDADGEFAIHPYHPNHGDFQTGYVEVTIKARFAGDVYSEAGVITIGLADYSDLSAPTMVQPQDGATLPYGSTQVFEVEERFGAKYYLFGFFQNGTLVHEGMVEESELEVYLGNPDFSKGEVEIWVRAWLGTHWTAARKVVVTLE